MPKIIESAPYLASLKSLKAAGRQVDEFLIGARFILDRDPREGFICDANDEYRYLHTTDQAESRIRFCLFYRILENNDVELAHIKQLSGA